LEGGDFFVNEEPVVGLFLIVVFFVERGALRIRGVVVLLV
jgi:hypothetical protein